SGFANSLTNETYAELLGYRNELQAEMSQAADLLKQLRSQKYDGQARQKIDEEVRDRREALHQAIVDLRKLVDSAGQKYAELSKNKDVARALDLLGKRSPSRPKLGPSASYVNSVKLLERLEKEVSEGDAQGAPEKSGRLTRKSPRHKRGLRGSHAAGARAA